MSNPPVKNRDPADADEGGTAAEIQEEIDAFLGGSTVASLATVDEHRRPHAANVWYVADEHRRLYFISSPDSEHGRHIARDGHVALSVYAHTAGDSVDLIRGLQIHGHCAMLPPGQHTDEALALFAHRYPHVAANPRLMQRLKTERFYRVTPTWLRWIDNRRGFGWKFETR